MGMLTGGSPAFTSAVLDVLVAGPQVCALHASAVYCAARRAAQYTHGCIRAQPARLAWHEDRQSMLLCFYSSKPLANVAHTLPLYSLHLNKNYVDRTTNSPAPDRRPLLRTPPRRAARAATAGADEGDEVFRAHVLLGDAARSCAW